MTTNTIRLAVLLASAGLLAACATREDVALLRQPPMPPRAVAVASPARPFYRNVAVQAVEGAPESGLFNTRPTRAEVLDSLTDHLRRADMLAPSRLDAEYVLYADFDDLRGPNVWPGADKLASARVTFRLVRWRTGQVVREKTVDASYESRWTGLTSGVAGARETSARQEVSTDFGGGERARAATRGLMDLAFDMFMGELGRGGAAVYKTAVSCAALNGGADRGPYLAETATAYGVDCPGARHNTARTARAYPSRF
jgi:hypothetical protein